MASRFSALPLSSGESFMLETDHNGKRWVILVDGGQSKGEGRKKNGLYKAIRKHCPEIKRKIDVAICTHRDHDHAGGFPAFIKTWLAEGKEIGELWLPGGWAGAVEMALTNPDRLVSMLHEGATEAAYQIGDQERSLERENHPMSRPSFREGTRRSIQSHLYEMCIEHSTREEPENSVPAGRTAEEDCSGGSSRTERVAHSWGFSADDWEAVRADLDSSEIHAEPLTERARAYDQATLPLGVYELIEEADPNFRRLIRWHVYREGAAYTQLARSLFRSSIDTAEAIREIASAAANFQIPVRWFDFAAFEKGSAPSGGIEGFLQPLNAVELKKVERETDALRLFFKLKLTEQNVASLVFQRLETETEPGAIFLGDSRLAFGIDHPERNFEKHLVQPTRAIVYTAAHHGSRNNDRAYEVLAEWLPGLFEISIAVRNGGVWNQTLSGFLKVKNRRCAQCYQCHGGDWAQLVQINSDETDWSWPSDEGIRCGMQRRTS